MVGDDVVFTINSILTTPIRRARYIESSQVASFSEACAKASMQNIDDVLRPFFATWTTSLLGSDLERLELMSDDSRIRALIETLVIQDECNALDPFAVPELPTPGSTYRIWPRDNAGIVIANEVGITELRRILSAKLLCPRTIIIRDYQIEPINMLLCEELADFRHLVREVPPTAAEPVPLAVLVRDVVDGARVDVESIVFRYVDPGYGFDSVLNSTLFRERYPDSSSVAGPKVKESVIKVNPAYEGGSTRFSMLRSANIQLGNEAEMYWLQHIFYISPELKTLELSLRNSADQHLEAGEVVPKLTNFSLHCTKISASDLLAMIAASKGSLTHITFQQVVLNNGSIWREVLTSIAKEYSVLASFDLRILRETNDGDPAVDFRDVRDEDIPEECRAGLELIRKGPAGNKRVTRLSYNGIDAGKVLGIIARLGYVPESLESGKRPT